MEINPAKSYKSAVFILTLVLMIYIIVAGRLKFYFPTEPANYLSQLSWSLLQGRLDLVYPNWDHDLSFYKDKVYIYWGPTPALLIIPLVLVFGLNVSDVFYTAFFSALAPLFIYLLLIKVEQLKLCRLSNFRRIILSFFFAFGTVYFSIAVRGGVWFTSQAFSTLYLLVSIYFLFSYCLNKKNSSSILSSLFLGLAIWGRPTLILYLPLFISLIYVYVVKQLRLKIFIRSLFLFISVLIILAFLAGLYNYLRFGSVIENGYQYMKEAPRFSQAQKEHGLFNIFYMRHNFYYNFLNPPTFSQSPPFISFDPEGNSFIFLSPLLLLTTLIFKKRYWKNQSLKIFNSFLLFCTVVITFLQLCFFGTGWFQFSARYLLDIIPLLTLLLAQIIESISKALLLSLVIASIIFNTAGALWLIGILK